MVHFPSRRVRILLAIPLLLVLLLAAVATLFPIRLLKGSVEKGISHGLGAKATIGSLERDNGISLNPRVLARDIHVSQPSWAGPGPLASIASLRFRLHLLPLLVGRLDIDVIDASGIRLDLIRTADGRVNWRPSGKTGEGSGAVDMSAARVDNAVIRYRDALQRRSATVAMRIDPASGLFADGAGAVDGAAVKLTVRGAAMTAGARWPFRAAVEGPRLAMRLTGSMRSPLDFESMGFHVVARADDLKRIDHVIEAGLFGTRAVTLTGDVRRENDTWYVERMTGKVGQSPFAGHVSAARSGGRVHLDGAVRFAALNFDDLASSAGNAKAVMLEQKEGLRLVPNTRIDIHKMHETDGRIAVRIDRLLPGRRPSSLTSMDAVLTIDHLRATIDPLRIGLAKGAITGRAIVDQRHGAALPLLTLALDMTNSSIGALAGGADGEVDARVDARVRLAGRGSTIREAIGASSGTVGIVARDGRLPEKIAAMMGFDLGKALLGGDGNPARLRCAVARLAMKSGTGVFAPLLIDTSISQARGTGTIHFPDEALDVKLTGMPKTDVTLRVPGSVILAGTIREPDIVVPKKVKSVGNILKAIGRKISGNDGARARDVDCEALGRTALG